MVGYDSVARCWLPSNITTQHCARRKFPTTCSASVSGIWSASVVASAARRYSPMPLCHALDCVHLHNEGLHRGLLSLRGQLVASPSRTFDSHVSTRCIQQVSMVFHRKPMLFVVKTLPSCLRRSWMTQVQPDILHQ